MRRIVMGLAFWMVLLPSLSVVAEEPTDVPGKNTDGNCGLHGTLFEKGTRRPLSGLTVALYPVGYSAITDAQGAFHFDRLVAGEYRLVVRSADHERLLTVKTLKNDQTAVVREYLATKRYKTDYFVKTHVDNGKDRMAFESKASSW